MIVSTSPATDGPISGLTVTVTDSITELANQMQLINEMIGRTLSSSKPASISASSPNQVCAKCVGTSEVLIALQSEVHTAMKRVEKMNQTLTVLQTHVNGLQRSIETIQSQVCTENSGSKLQSQVSKSLVEQRWDVKRTENNNSQSNSQQDANKEQAPNANVSFREMLHKKMGSPNPIPTMGLSGANTKINTPAPAQNIETLDELILSCAPYLTGPPVEYTTWLHDELNINTIAHLSEAVADNLGMLVVGNGSVGMWQKQKFCDMVQVAAASVALKSGTDSSKENGIDEVDELS